MPRFSIVVPVYNVENYLPACVESILSQSFRDFELILIDDGSKDGSSELCDEYHEKDNRVIVIHRQNGGAAAARNDGIRLAKGDYVTFVDSDDYWDDKDALQKINTKLSETDADVLEQRLKSFHCETEKIDFAKPFPPELEQCATTAEVLQILVSTETYQISAALKVIRCSFLLEHELLFPEGVTCEDILWGIRISAASPKYAFLNLYHYCYRAGRPGSVTSNIREKNIQDYIFVLSRAYEAVQQADPALQESLRGYLLYQSIIAIALVQNLSADKTTRTEFLAQIRALFEDDLKRKALHPKAKKACMAYKLLGFRGMAFVLGRYLAIR